MVEASNSQMEAMHSSSSLRAFLELKKVEQVFWEARKPRAGFPESLGSGKGQICAYPTPEVRLLSKQTFMLEELQVLPKALRAMRRMKGAGLCLGEEGRSLGGGNIHPHPWLMERFITDTRGDESPRRGHFLRTPFSDHCQQKTQSYQELKKEKHKIA